jgi:hypothetical protein
MITMSQPAKPIQPAQASDRLAVAIVVMFLSSLGLRLRSFSHNATGAGRRARA